MNNNSWRHHYIPQFYLKGFTNNKGFFKIFDKEENKFIKNGREFSPKSWFFQRNDNTIIEGDLLELGYASIDSNMALNLDNILSIESRTDETVSSFQVFVEYLYWRIPKNRSCIKELILKNDLNFLGFNLENSVGKITQTNTLEEKIKSSKDFISFYRFALPLIRSSIKCKMPLSILEFPEGLPAICSDNPIIVRNPRTFDINTDNYILPLNNTMILVRGNVISPYKSSIKLSIDYLMFKQAYRYVSCTDKEYIHKLEEAFGSFSDNLLIEKIFDNLIRD